MMNKILNICGCCLSFQLFSMKVQARCRQPPQPCPGLLCSPCGTEGHGGHVGHRCAGHSWRARAEPARNLPPHIAGKKLQGQCCFTGKIILIPMKTLPGRERPLKPGEASLGWRQCCDIFLHALNFLPGFHAHMFSAPRICCFGCGVSPHSTAPGSRCVLIPKVCFEWDLWGHRELGRRSPCSQGWTR